MCVCSKCVRDEPRNCMGSVCLSAMNSHSAEFQKECLTQHYGRGTPLGSIALWTDSLFGILINVINIHRKHAGFSICVVNLRHRSNSWVWSWVVIFEWRLEHNRTVTLLRALEDHAASPRVQGGPCACAGAVSVFGWGLRLDKERPRLLLLWHFSNW